MNPFDQFLTGLRADVRLGKYLPPPTPHTTAETIVLALTIALATATEGNRTNPSFPTLDELDAAETAAWRNGDVTAVTTVGAGIERAMQNMLESQAACFKMMQSTMGLSAPPNAVSRRRIIGGAERNCLG